MPGRPTACTYDAAIVTGLRSLERRREAGYAAGLDERDLLDTTMCNDRFGLLGKEQERIERSRGQLNPEPKCMNGHGNKPDSMK